MDVDAIEDLARERLEEARLARAAEEPIVGGLPDVPGIGVAMRLTPELGIHLRGLADAVLVRDYPGATIGRAEREMLATAVSASNDCFFCMDSHAEHATAVLERDGAPGRLPALEGLKLGALEPLDPKLQALVRIARTVGRRARDLTTDDVRAARDAGATDGDVQLAVLIASAFSMYNRLVDGFRARTPADPEAYKARAAEIAVHGYSPPPER
jgi:AhpD family alkylhydroperoxidase